MAQSSKGVAWQLGSLPYMVAWRMQQSLHRARMERNMDEPLLPHSLLCLEHTPVYTLGRGATAAHLRFDPATETVVEVHRVERGGQVTYHGPGQATVYPIIDLRDPALKQDLHWYVTGIEETIIACLSGYGVQAQRMAGKPGVWVHEPRAPPSRLPWRKIAAVGMACSKWVTYHGLAVNVGPGLSRPMDMAAWDRIVPCGIGDEDKGVTSLQLELLLQDRQDEAAALAMTDFTHKLCTSWSSVFNMALELRQGMPSREELGEAPGEVGVAEETGHITLPRQEVPHMR